MRKIIVFPAGMIILFFGIIAGVSFAAPIGNPSQPAITQYHDTPLSLGIENDIIFEKELEHGGRDLTLKGFWPAAKISYTLFERVDIYSLLGAADWRLRRKNLPAEDVKYLANMSFAWGWGGKALLFKNKRGFGIGTDLRYRHHRADIGKVKLDGRTYTDVDGKAGFREWQTALAVSWDLSEFTYTPDVLRFIPYAGVRWTQTKIYLHGRVPGVHDFDIDEAKSKRNAGAVIGFDLYFDDVPRDEEIGLNIEVRFVDETAICAGLNYRF